jgi:hypothetical protein
MRTLGYRGLLCGVAVMCCMAGDAGAQSAVVCDGYARQYAENASKQGQMLGRGAVGSLVGAGIGLAFGGAAVGAAIGGGLGLVSGGAKRNETANRMYNAAYQDCMAGRTR